MEVEPDYTTEHVITDPARVRAILGETFESQVNKVIDQIDEHCRAWIERSPFVVIATSSGAGLVDVSPKGDPPGFVRVLDARTLAVPDRPGNHRGDTFLNVLENPEVGLMFVVPNRREVVRVSGTAQVVDDPALLESMAVDGKVPSLALVVRVREAMFHCGKSMVRSHMWEPERWGSIEGLPSYGQALVDHGNLERTVDDMQASVEANERDRLYDD
jgi:PPOX class probable FMN-dependent enzyme